jgi:hypothetical protein
LRMYNEGDSTSLSEPVMSARPNTTDSVIGNLRQSIATQAARLIAEEGIEDFAFAKRKAARQLGVPARDLPSNAEIEDALQSYRALFRDEDDEVRLERMREAALMVMETLEPFRPYVTGPVLTGLGDAFAEVELEVFADSAKDVELFLLSKGIQYEHSEVRQSGHDAPEAILLFDHEGVPVKLSVFDHVAERTPHRNHSGTISERLRLAAFLTMLEHQTDVPG